MRSLVVVACLASLVAVSVPQVAFSEDTKAPKVEVKVTSAKVTVPAASQPVAAPAAPATKVVEPAPAPTQEWWKVLIRYLLELVFAVLGVMATAFVTVLMKKYGFEDYTNKVNDILSRGIGYAEQKSAVALKLSGKPTASAEKLEIALKFIEEKAKEYKLPDKGREWWEKKVEGWLGVQKMNGAK